MGFFDNAVSNAVPEGNLTKPLVIAAGALLLAKFLHGNSSETPAPAPTPVPAPSAPDAAPTPDASAGEDQSGGLLGGLGGLLQKFQQAGHGDVINSWIGHGQNQQIQPGTLGQVLGQDTLQDLAQKAGVNPNDLLGQLAQNLPNIINALTPNGRMPTHTEVNQR